MPHLRFVAIPRRRSLRTSSHAGHKQPSVRLSGTARRMESRCRRKRGLPPDRKSTRLNSSHQIISYAVFCLKKKKQKQSHETPKTTSEHYSIVRIRALFL